MPFLKRLSTSINISKWGKKSKRNSKERSSSQKMKGVRFDPWPQIINSDYEITEDVQEALWYQQEDFVKISNKLDELAGRAVTKKNRSAGGGMNSECYRGLEMLIRDKASRLNGQPTVEERHRIFARGLVELQRRQLCQGYTRDEEEIRTYCIETSRKKQAVAEILAARDALLALRIYEDSDHWKMPMQDTSDTTATTSSTTSEDQDHCEKPKEVIRKVCRRTSVPPCTRLTRRSQARVQ